MLTATWNVWFSFAGQFQAHTAIPGSRSLVECHLIFFSCAKSVASCHPTALVFEYIWMILEKCPGGHWGPVVSCFHPSQWFSDLPWPVTAQDKTYYVLISVSGPGWVFFEHPKYPKPQTLVVKKNAVWKDLYGGVDHFFHPHAKIDLRCMRSLGALGCMATTNSSEQAQPSLSYSCRLDPTNASYIVDYINYIKLYPRICFPCIQGSKLTGQCRS